MSTTHLPGVHVRGLWLIPSCSCGWTGRPTATSLVANRRHAEHLTDVDAPAVAVEPDPGPMARRYLGAGR